MSNAEAPNSSIGAGVTGVTEDMNFVADQHIEAERPNYTTIYQLIRGMRDRDAGK